MRWCFRMWLYLPGCCLQVPDWTQRTQSVHKGPSFVRHIYHNPKLKYLIKLTLLICFRVLCPKISIESKARNEPSAVTISTLRTGIEAAQKRSANPISKTNCFQKFQKQTRFIRTYKTMGLLCELIFLQLLFQEVVKHMHITCVIIFH